MDKLAENLQRLQEDDLLQVVQMIYDHKSSDSVTKNDVDGGAPQSHVWLCSLLHSGRVHCRPLLAAGQPCPDAVDVL